MSGRTNESIPAAEKKSVPRRCESRWEAEPTRRPSPRQATTLAPWTADMDAKRRIAIGTTVSWENVVGKGWMTTNESPGGNKIPECATPEFNCENISSRNANRVVIVLALGGALVGAVGVACYDEKSGPRNQANHPCWNARPGARGAL